MWTLVQRSGSRTLLSVAPRIVTVYAQNAAKAFGVGENKVVAFDKTLAKGDVKKTEKKGK